MHHIAHETLFKRTSTGAIQTWFVEREGDKYRTHSGQLHGAMTVSEWTTAQPKNVGRSNETSGEEQAALEVAAKYEKKLKSGYFQSVEAIDEATFFKPMLAKPYDKHPPSIMSEEWYSQPKLDGIRCIAKADGLWTRTGERIPTCPHIERALAPFFKANPFGVVDGELYADRLADNFNKLVSLAKRKNPTPEQLKAAEALEYHVYDMFFPNTPFVSFIERFIHLSLAVNELVHPHPIRTVRTDLIIDAEFMDERYAAYVEQGQEGQILRRGASPYQNKRTADLIKRKEFVDEEFVILSVHEGQGNRSGMAGYVTLALDTDRTFKATPKGTNAHRTKMLEHADQLVGKVATVQFFNYTPAGVPRFPVLKVIHDQPRW